MVLHFLPLHQGQAVGLCSLLHMCQMCVKIALAKILCIYLKLLRATVRWCYPHQTIQEVDRFTQKEIPVYYNLGLNFAGLVIISIGNKNIVVSRLIAEILECCNMAKEKADHHAGVTLTIR